MLWAIIKKQLNGSWIHTKQQAIDEIVNLWNAIPKRMINELCESFATRMAMMKEGWGETIQPLLSSNVTTVLAGYLPDKQYIVSLASWTADDDERLARKRAEEPQIIWELLVHFFPGRTPTFRKNRWKIVRTQLLIG
jgi:hypothetical protein